LKKIINFLETKLIDLWIVVKRQLFKRQYKDSLWLPHSSLTLKYGYDDPKKERLFEKDITKIATIVNREILMKSCGAIPLEN